MALRGDRNYPDVYLGRPGALVKLPYPRGDMDKPFDRQVYDFQTATGQHIVSSMIGGARTYNVQWNALHYDNYKLIEQYWTGMMGQGPWVFIDPSSPNLLMPNCASSTNLWGDARNFIPGGGAVLSNTVATNVHRTGALRSIRWYFATTTATVALWTSPGYRSWYGIPVVPGLSYAWSSWVKPDGIVDSAITVGVGMDWMDATGTTLSTVRIDTPITGWTKLPAVGVAPAGAVYAKPFWIASGATVSAGASLYIDEPLFEQDTVVNDWAPGMALRPVEIIDFNETVPFNARFRKGITMTLKELAP